MILEVQTKNLNRQPFIVLICVSAYMCACVRGGVFVSLDE